MKKYLYIFKLELMTNLQYSFDILVGFIGYAVHIFIFLNLWKYIYSNPNELINGYSMNQMIWYVIITEILWMCIGGRSLCRKISNDVRSGNIAYNLNKPYNYVEYSLFNHLGSTIVKFFLVGIIGIILGLLFLKEFPNITLLQGLGILLSSLLAITINILFLISIGLLSFIVEDANPFYWVYSKLILVLGITFPIEFFPNFIQPIIKYSPVYVVSYGPAKLFVEYNNNTFIHILIFQTIYIIIAFTIANLIYKKGVKKLNVNGG